MSIIAVQNDAFRKSLIEGHQKNGQTVLTRSVSDLPFETQCMILGAVADYDTFDTGNDPYDEHDFGAIELPNVSKVFWKIDYYEDNQCKYGAEDPTESYRILTIMLADDY